MKNTTILGLLTLSCLLNTQDFNRASHKGFGSMFHKIENFFHKPTSVSISLPAPHLDPSVLSPFQILFRETVSFTSRTNNALCSLAEAIMQEAEDQFYTVEQATERFLEEIQRGGILLLHKILLETLDVDLENLVPHFLCIQQQIALLQQRVSELSHNPLLPQIQELLQLVEATQERAARIQKEGLIALSSQLASSAFFGKQYPLVDCFNELYTVYPTVIQKIDRLYLRETGLIAHSIFNLSSELLEQLIFLHESAGKIGTIFVHNDLIGILDQSKNQVRKLGNALEFITSTQPLIVTAPPTTIDALLHLLQTCVWGDGLKLRPLVTKEVENALKIATPLIAQLKPYSAQVKSFGTLVADMPAQLHSRFLNSLRESPTHNIPRSPALLLELLEDEVAILKQELHQLVEQPIYLTQQLCPLLTISARLLEYTNVFMGSTKTQPFIHPEIIRGLGFVVEDADDVCNVMVRLVDEIDQFKLLHRGKLI